MSNFNLEETTARVSSLGDQVLNHKNSDDGYLASRKLAEEFQSMSVDQLSAVQQKTNTLSDNARLDMQSLESKATGRNILFPNTTPIDLGPEFADKATAEKYSNFKNNYDHQPTLSFIGDDKKIYGVKVCEPAQGPNNCINVDVSVSK